MLDVTSTGGGGVVRQVAHATTANTRFIRTYTAQNGWSDWIELVRADSIANFLVPVGIPMPWPTATPPTGWLKCNGASFSATNYPELAKAYPSLKLPDLRGEFIRGWDDGRGADSGRSLLSGQTATGIRTAAVDYPGIDATTSGATVGTAYNQADTVTRAQPADAKTPDNGVLGGVLSDNSIQATQLQSGISGGSVWITTRPRNIAFNYIMRAA